MLSSQKADRQFKAIGEQYHRSIESSNEQALNPDGSTRVELSDSAPYYYATNKAERVGSTLPDLIYSGTARDSLDVYVKDDGFSMYHSNARADSYMADHEFGREGMPKGAARRRQFPTEDDSKSSYQEENISKVQEILAKHLNSQRTLVVNG